MPCYEAPLEHTEREREFLVAALCHATKYLTDGRLESFPGLEEWKKRHDFFDTYKLKKGEWSHDKLWEERTRGKYDSYRAPLFMEQFMRAFPKKE